MGGSTYLRSPCRVVPQEHPHWFVMWMISFTAVFILYVRVMFAASLPQERISVVPVLTKGVLTSGKCLLHYKSCRH
jgi:hypothetical protein